MTKERIEKAFAKAGKNVADILKLIEEQSGAITREDLDKGFHWLMTVVAANHQQAQIVHTMNKESEGFSFDMELPKLHTGGLVPNLRQSQTSPSTTIVNGQHDLGATRQLTTGPLPPRALGRIVGTDKVLVDSDKAPDPALAQSLNKNLKDDESIGFLDE